MEIPESIKAECAEMQRFLEQETPDDPNILFERISRTNVYLARSGKLLAEVKLYQDQEMAEVFAKYSEYINALKATTANKFIESQLASVNYYVNWLDRLNRAFVHSGDNMRTQMSFLKEDLRLTKSGY